MCQPHRASVETALGSLLHVNNAALSYSYGEACVFIVYGFERQLFLCCKAVTLHIMIHRLVCTWKVSSSGAFLVTGQIMVAVFSAPFDRYRSQGHSTWNAGALLPPALTSSTFTKKKSESFQQRDAQYNLWCCCSPAAFLLICSCGLFSG